MNPRVVTIAVLLSTAACAVADDAGSRGGDSAAAPVLAGVAMAGAPALPAGAAPVSAVPDSAALAMRAAEDSVYTDAAATAWKFIDRNYVPRTGLVRPFDHYTISTMWDVASGLAGLFAATELGLLPRSEYDGRMARALSTLATMPLFDGIGFNKEYRVDDGAIIGVTRRPAKTGFGVSATDHGRLLMWLRILADRHPQHRAAAERVVARLDLAAFEEDGYLVGHQLSRRTGRRRDFQEGRLGYEQYAARGFRAWGLEPRKALDISEHLDAKPVEGIAVPGDERGGDRLTSEPFVLLALEAGWTPAERAAAVAVLAAQEARHARTRILTLVSEDAIDRAPDYFFYYTVLSPQGPWSIDVQRPGVKVTGPRWVSSKAAFGWHAVMPGAYTRMVLDTVYAKARVRGSWGSGVFEDGRPTGNPNVNTAAVILESALFRRNGGPLLRAGEGAPASAPAPAGASAPGGR